MCNFYVISLYPKPPASAGIRNTHIKKWTVAFCCLMVCIFSQSVHALAFDTNQTILLKGKGEQLADNEGYLYLSIDSETAIKYFTIWHVDGGKQIRFDNVSTGKHQALIKLKAGKYYWVRFKIGNYFYDFKRDQFPFTVQAGRINYPGTWHFDFASKNNIGTLYINKNNQFTSALEDFKEHHGGLLKDYQFTYQGDFTDRFSEHYAQYSKKAIQDISVYNNVSYIAHEKNNTDEEEKNFPDIKKYFKENNQSIGKLNPNGQFLFYSTTIEEYTTINILSLATYESFVIYKEKIPQHSYINNIQWIDNDSIYYSIHSPQGNLNLVVHLTSDSQHKITSVNHLVIPYHGRLVAPLTDQGNHIYFGNRINYKVSRRGLYKVDTSSKKSIKKSLKKHFSLFKKLKGGIYWLTGHDGEVRFVITEIDGEYHYWYLPINDKPQWKKIGSFKSSEDLVVPDMISRDGKSFYVLTDKFSDRKSIQEYSTEDFAHKGSIFEDVNINVEGLLTDPSSGELIGVKYVENGYYKFKYFHTNKDALNTIRMKNPQLQLFSIHDNPVAQIILLYGISEYTKGTWYLYKTDTKEILKLFSQDAVYDQLTKGTFIPLKIKSEDGLEIEGYLVTPKHLSKNKKVPLIVIPHGGPIGVRDYAYETDIQHFYASQGFASLKINYRGSGGFGKKFEESGNLQWGEKIESDINAMVDHVVEHYTIDADQICSMGASYGGYSAIMLTILYPNRYKCAVSLAGVTDISLMFSSSDFRYDEKALELFSKIVGDPKKDLQKMTGKSPVYLTDKIKRPIMLFHGDNDKRVTLEHSLRLKVMMDKNELPVDLTVFKNEGHSFEHNESNIIYIARSLQFIQQQLKISEPYIY